MLYIIVIIISIIIGLLRGGEIEELANISIKGVTFFAIALFLRVSAWGVSFLGIGNMEKFNSFLIIISYVLLIYVSMQNIKMPGFKYINLGILLNAFVIFLNGGKMPVLIGKEVMNNANTANIFHEESIVHSLMNSDTMFAFLGDVISMPKPFPDNSIISVGDILILTGIFILIQKIMTREVRSIHKDEIIE